MQRDGFLLRVPLVGGLLSAEQVQCLAEAPGNGIVELTNRGNLQIRGLAANAILAVLDRCRAVGLGDALASLVTISPFAGAAEHGVRSTLVRALAQVDTARLSHKFVVHVDDAVRRTADRIADLRVWLTSGGDYEVTVRGLGTTTCVSTAELAMLAHRLAECCLQHGSQARAADVAASEGSAALAAALGATRPWQPSPLPQGGSQPLTVGVTAVHKQLGASAAAVPRQLNPTVVAVPKRLGDGVAAVPRPFGSGEAGTESLATGTEYLAVAAARFGRVSSTTLAGIGRMLRAHHLDRARISPWRSFVFTCSSPPQAAAVLADAASLGLLTDRQDPALGVVACIGSAGCWQTQLDTLEEAERFVANRPADIEPGALVHISGCDKFCATRAPVALTLVGRRDASGFDVLGAPLP